MSTSSGGVATNDFVSREQPLERAVHRTKSSNAADHPPPRSPGSSVASARSSSSTPPTSGGSVDGIGGSDEHERAEKVMVTLQAMLRQERIFYERKCKEYVQNPSVRVKDSLTESEQRIAKLEQQLSDCTKRLQASALNSPSPLSRSSQSVSVELSPTTTVFTSSLPASNNMSKPATSPSSITNTTTATSPSGTDTRSLQPSRETFQPRASSPSIIKPPLSSATPVRSKSISTSLHTTSSFNNTRQNKHASKPAPISAATIIIDDEDFDEEVATDNITGAFSSLDNLVVEPARMAVFIRYLLDDTGQDNYPDALFFYLLTGIYRRQRSSSAKETRRFAQAILGLFFAESAPLHVDIDPPLLEAIKAKVMQKGTDEGLSLVFNDARYVLANGVISAQLESYREKRMLGFGSLFGEDDLLAKISTKEEKTEAIRKLLCPVLNQLAGMDPTFSTLDQNVSTRNAALSMALLTFLEDSGVLVESSIKVASRQSTNRKKKPLGIFNRNKTNQIKIIQGHHFLPTHYNSPVYCDHCSGLLWGLGYQGFTCQLCGFNVHQRSCNQLLKDPCQGESYRERSSAMAIVWKKHSMKPSTSTSTLTSTPSKTASTSATTAAVSASSTVSSMPALTDTDTVSPSDCQLSTVSSAREASPLIAKSSASFRHAGDSNLASAAATGADVARDDTYQERRGSLRDRPRNFPLSQSTGAADAATSGTAITAASSAGELGNRRPSSTNVNRAQSLNYPKRPAAYDRSDRRHKTTESLAADVPPMRSPSLNDISADTDGSPGSMSPEHGKVPFAQHAPDPEMEYDEDVPPWLETVTSKDPGFLKSLSKTDKNRQGLIHELIHTEATHLKKLKLILNCFYLPIKNAELLPRDQEQRLFPEIDALIEHHRHLLQLMRAKMDPNRHGYVTAISDVFLQSMDLGVGDEFLSAASQWVCRNQENLDYIRRMQSNLPRFGSFMKVCETKEVLNRLPLGALTPSVMQRLTKYPLLLEGIKKHTLREADPAEYANLEAALTICKNALSLVNGAIQQYENSKFLQDVQNKLDTKDLDKSSDFHISSYATIDLSLKKVVHRSDLQWRVKNAVVPVHALLLTDLIVLLEYNSNRSQYYLRVHEDFGSVVRVNDLHVREVANDKKSLYLVDLKGEPPKMYSLQALNATDCRRWIDCTTKVTKEIKSLQPAAAVPGGFSPNMSTRSRSSQVASTMLKDRPLPANPPYAMQRGRRTSEVPADMASSDDDETRIEKQEDEFAKTLLETDEMVVDRLKSLQVGDRAPARRVSDSRRGTASIEPVLDSCVQQARLVSSLARELMQPQSAAMSANAGDPMPVVGPLQPANYQLVEASQQLSLQLASMQSLVLKRERAINEVQKELDYLREKSKALGPSVDESEETDGNFLMEDEEDDEEEDSDDDSDSHASASVDFEPEKTPTTEGKDKSPTQTIEDVNDHADAAAETAQLGESSHNAGYDFGEDVEHC
eukprot:scpid10634/ scgid17567/ Rho guanine nucleotide exchange factor 1; Lbc&apos; Lymphoid blast crisis-like 2